MATIALDIHAPGFAVQSYQDRVQQLTDVIVRHLAHFRRIALRLLGNIADAEDQFRTLSCLPSHTWISSEDKRRCPCGSRPS